ncbi:Aminobenzoyl-glutamate utilization protein B [Bhargavaea cecembensis DSE10]|uniref:Aminobenzoyl-glutamate utilization protein B n=1 Tax=Bhargavaea cecembensis DSE10 TaxID=1235279 RepID=M7N8N4_9BACL|nr:M20 family metallopeptidase [Bhargavaea cecembensis]EMR04963.1 Aminobenzoyl-glutamate utilization protein B [Bhargavaea cecembensis DSE10]
MGFHETISNFIEQKKDKYIELSDRIWSCPELYFAEHRSSEILAGALEEEGFEVQRKVAGLETGFVASYGGGKPVIAVLGEFDALAGLSQEKGLTKHHPLEVGGNGHGCGHNLLGTGSLAAAVAVKAYMEETGLKGTIRYYGCPAEENGSGKAYMVRAGLFEDVDLAFSWHPMTKPSVWHVSTLANYAVRFRFEGKSAHAAAAPHLGRSALDAVELMNMGVNYLREHMVPEARIHYAITDAGGASPNVVQANAEVLYFIRATKKQQVKELTERVNNIAKGAALMTGTSVEGVFEGAASDLVPNSVLAETMYRHLSAIGVPSYDEQDYRFAEEIQATLSREDIEADLTGPDRETAKKLKDKAIADFIAPFAGEAAMAGSTDVGDVSWVVPTTQCLTACFALGTPLHTWQVVSQGAMPIAHKGMLQAAKVIACTAIDAMENQEVIENATLEWKERLNGESYISLIPDDKTSPKR